MTHFLSLHRVGLLVALLLASAASTLYAQTITTFDIPDSTATRPLAINLEGQIAGSYMPATPDQFGDLFVFDQRGFVREPDGTVRSIDGKFLGEPYTASATAINLQGRAIGNMRYDVDSVFSFVRETDGTVTAVRYDPSHSDAQVDVPNYVRGTTPTDINDWGQIVGVFAEPPSNIGLLRQVNGTFTTFFIPRIDSFPETFPQAINDLGQITGYAATDGTFAFHGFLRQRDGTFVVFDPLDSTGTYAQAINLLGEITGSYTTADGVSHGLLRKHN